MLDDWMPDFACAAEYGWNPPDEIPDFETQMARIRRRLLQIKDAVDPDPAEVDPPAWDGIWLKDGKWFKDIIASTAKS
jgi:hypothetical protein